MRGGEERRKKRRKKEKRKLREVDDGRGREG